MTDHDIDEEELGEGNLEGITDEYWGETEGKW